MAEGPPSPGESLTPEEGVAPSHAAAEGAPAEEAMGSASTAREMLFATEPHQSLDGMESPWDPDRGGPKRLVRGFQKMIDVDGVPAIVDVTVGTLETLVVMRKNIEKAQQAGEDDAGHDEGNAMDPDLASLVSTEGR
ncbi:hypothetical protein [Haloferax sp. Q22]|uniref:hypothetical protein n=1 Tax=Haloferax sp. (strain Q22) TaxID=1526048 RepID=UPI000737B303|nr:hypothetical protein [Haloferax sp. Q22]